MIKFDNIWINPQWIQWIEVHPATENPFLRVWINAEKYLDIPDTDSNRLKLGLNLVGE